MSINSIGSVNYGMDAYNKTNVKNNDTNKNVTQDDTAVVYEKSSNKEASAVLKNQFKADQEAIKANYQKMVQDMISDQNNAINKYNQTIVDIMNGKKTLKEAAEEAAKEISEDGYWGVKQTSERIFDFAKALCGGDASKMPSMLEAFKKGYDEAAKAFGGELPEICKQTYDAVLQKFEDYTTN